jgi:hypothetical protein
MGMPPLSYLKGVLAHIVNKPQRNTGAFSIQNLHAYIRITETNASAAKRRKLPERNRNAPCCKQQSE